MDAGASAGLRAAVLAALIALGLAIYLVLLKILGVTSPRELVQALRRKL
jgi:hypothetical protein